MGCAFAFKFKEPNTVVYLCVDLRNVCFENYEFGLMKILLK